MPVDLDRAGNVTDLVEQHVLVRFDDDQPRRTEVVLQPVGGDQTRRVRV